MTTETKLFNILKNRLKLTDTVLDEILKGAFVVVKNDNAALYDDIMKSELKKYTRTSSHPSLNNENNYGVIIKGLCIGTSTNAVDNDYLRTFLFGKIRCDKKSIDNSDPNNFCKKVNSIVSVYAPPKKYKLCTWFQFESYRWDSPNQTVYDTVLHAVDYFRYIYENKNFGPLGSSVYTGRPALWNPLVIEFKNEETCLLNKQQLHKEFHPK